MSLASTVAEKVHLIGAIANILTCPFKPHRYGEVILPLTVIRRFDSVLESSKNVVLDANKKYAGSPFLDTLLQEASGYAVFNTVPFSFTKLLDVPADVEVNFRAFCNAFFSNVRERHVNHSI